MIVPPALTYGRFGAAPRQPKAGPNHAPLLAVSIVAAGIVAAAAAATASGPFAGLRPTAHSPATTAHLVRNTIPIAPIEASTLFPPPAPAATVQKVVNVYDLPAPAGTRTSGQSSDEMSSATGSSNESEHHGARPTPAPTNQPAKGHGGGGAAPGGGTPPGDD